MSIAAKYNLAPANTPTAQASETHKMGRAGVDDQITSTFWHPDSPLFWVGTLVAVTIGLAAVSGSGSIKLGPLHASASAGAGKK